MADDDAWNTNVAQSPLLNGSCGSTIFTYKYCFCLTHSSDYLVHLLQMAQIPVELICQILCRQPVKSLLRFRCVSKSWRSLIDSPNFIRLHLDHSIATSSNLSLICGNSKLYSIDFDTDNVVQLSCPKNLYSLQQVMGSCNGLLALFYYPASYFIWNPATRVYREFFNPPSKLHYEEVIMGGLGYDAIREDYKLIVILKSSESDDDSSDSDYDPNPIYLKNKLIEYPNPRNPEVHVYSLKANSWKRVQDFPCLFSVEYRHNSVCVSNAIHWSIKISTNCYTIFAYDFGTEQFRDVPQPNDFPQYDVIDVHDLGGCFGLTCHHGQHIDMWVMKEYGNEESWVKQFSFMHTSEFDVRPVAYTKNGDQVIFAHLGLKMFCYDLSAESIERFKICGDNHFSEACLCMASLVPINGGCRISGQDKIKRLVMEED